MTDFTQLSRLNWIDLFDRFNHYLYATVSTFTHKEWNRRSPYIGWRVRDVLVNITRAKVVNFRQLLDRALSDNPIAPEEFNTFLRGQREVDARREWPVSVILEDYMREYERLQCLYRQMTDNDFMKPGWFFVGPMNIRGLLLTEFGDNVFHLRDMLLPNRKWEGLDPTYTGPLVDWFIREYRPAHFRADKACGIRAKILYRLSGTGGGAWTMTIENGKCSVTSGAADNYDVILAADVEDLVAVALARTAPWIGALARGVDWIQGPDGRTEVVATIQHYCGFVDAIVRGKIRIGGNRKLGMMINRRCFWHFYQRTRMTEERIRQSRQA